MRREVSRSMADPLAALREYVERCDMTDGPLAVIAGDAARKMLDIAEQTVLPQLEALRELVAAKRSTDARQILEAWAKAEEVVRVVEHPDDGTRPPATEE